MSTRLWGSVNLNVIWKRSDFWQLRDKVTEVVYKVTKVVYKVTKVVYKVTEVVYKVTEVVYKLLKWSTK